MNVLDENIAESQRQLLRHWHVSVRQIGQEVGRKGIADAEIIPLLHQLSRPTFFSRDTDFYRRELCHSAYCLVSLEVGKYEVASFIRRFLQHPAFSTFPKRRGSLVRVSHRTIHVWRTRSTEERKLTWLYDNGRRSSL